MSEEKTPRVRKPVDMTPAVNAKIISDLGATSAKLAFGLARDIVKAGETDLFEGYAGSIISADLLHSAGLLSDQAYSAIFVMETIMGGISAIDSVLGSIPGSPGSPFTPSLKTKIEQHITKSSSKDDEEE